MSTHRTRRTWAVLGLLALLSVTGCGMPTSPLIDPSAGTVGSSPAGMSMEMGSADENQRLTGGGSPATSDTLVTQLRGGQGGHHGRKPKKH